MEYHFRLDLDGDHGTRIEFLKSIRRKVIKCVFLETRFSHSGYGHIGSRRFTHLNESCAKGIDALYNNK